MNEKIGIIHLGCAKNRVDGEMLMYTLKQADFEIVDDILKADVVIVNTCGFIDSAKQEAIDTIINLGELKNEGIIKAIIVTGCLAERYREQVLDQLFEADAVVGIGSNSDIVSIVKKVLKGTRITDCKDKLLLPLEGGRIQSTPKHYAYLKIAEGCNNKCAYCAIPLIRGEFRSRRLESLVKEAKQLAQNGVKELIVIAQDTTKYGEDIYGKSALPKLLTELCKIDGLVWIRLLYCYPDRISDELLDVMAREDKILNYIDLPLQHCSGNVLKSMNRKGDYESLKALIKHIRAKLPNVTLRTTLITGFPGESEEDFELLSQFVNEVKFERLGCFAYSREEDTPAFEFDNQVDEETKVRRCDIIMNQQQRIMDEYSLALKGACVTVLAEGYDEDEKAFFGRSCADSPDVDGNVFFTSSKNVKPGSFVKVRITSCAGCDTYGEEINN